MSKQIYNRVVRALRKNEILSGEDLDATYCLVRMWKTGRYEGADPEIVELLRYEEFDEDEMTALRELLVRKAESLQEPDLFGLIVQAIGLFDDSRDIEFFRESLAIRLEALMQDNRAIWSLLITLNSMGECVSQRDSLSVENLDANVADVRSYLSRVVGVNVSF